MKPAASSGSAATGFLRLYGIACVGWAVIGLWLDFTIKPGTRGIADWTRGWPELMLLVFLGITVFLLLRWFVLLFSILSTGFGAFFAFASVTRVPFPAEFLNLLCALLMILPAFLTYRAWQSLR